METQPQVQPSAEDRARQDGLLIASVVLTVMAGIFVVLRSISRFILIRTPGADDYFMLGAMSLTIGYLINLFILKENKLGFPMATLTLDNMTTFLKVMYYATICCIKTSIVLTYLRFAVSRTFRMVCYGTIAFHGVFFLICITVTLAQCFPLHKMWDFTGTVEGQCINTTAFFYTTSAFNIVTDFWILLMPFKTLKAIQRPKREKIALFIIFGVGSFAAVASIVRLHTIYIYTLATDPFRDGVAVNLWSMVEVTFAISCASVSALKPIFSSRQRQASRKAKSTARSNESGGASTYMQSQNGNGPRQHVRLASLDNSVKGVLNSCSSNQDRRSAIEKGHDSDTEQDWSVPANLRQPPTARRQDNGFQDGVELTFLQSDKEGRRQA